MKLSWPKQDKPHGAYVTIYILVVIAVLAAVNYLADQRNASYYYE